MESLEALLGVVGSRDPAPPVEDPTERLRAARTVLECDAVLRPVQAPDWDALAAAHRAEPFGRAQRRALIARRDCPDAVTEALLTPWDSLVAGRLAVRGGPVPEWAWRAAMQRIGEVRPALVREALSEATVEELVLTVPRLDLLVRVVDTYDHNHGWQVLAFWECVGRLLRERIGGDRRAWLSVAAELPRRRGGFGGLLRRPAAGVPASRADLRVLAHAPDPVLAQVVAELPDAALAEMAERDLRLRTDESVMGMILQRLVAAGVPPRPLFAAWAYGANRTPEVQAWAHGLDWRLDWVADRAAEYDATLRRLLASRHPHLGHGGRPHRRSSWLHRGSWG